MSYLDNRDNVQKWTDGEALVAIARLGNFRAAAIDLDVSLTAIGSAIARLDNRLGVRLLNRTTTQRGSHHCWP